MRVLLDPSLEWFGEKHLPFALPAIFILCIFVFLPALFLLLYPMKIFQKYLGCCGGRLLALHAFADVFQGCYKNGTNGTRDCRYFAGLYLVFRIVLLLEYSGYTFVFYKEILLPVCLVTASLLFLLFRPYKNNSWLNIWDSIAFSFLAFQELCTTYAIYVGSVPIQIFAVFDVVPPVYLTIYVTYRLVVWMKTLQICKKKQRNQLIPETEEPDRLTHPEDYERDDVYLLLSDGQENHRPQDPELETYPACGNSQQKYGSV